MTYPKIRIRFRTLASSLAICLTLTCGIHLNARPQHLVFTYHGDTSTSLTANWQILGPNATPAGDANVYYDTVSHNGDPTAYANSAKGLVSTIEGLNDRTIYRTQIDNLQADTCYYVIVGNTDQGYSKEVKVRTIPNDDSELRFVTGGDMGTSDATRILLRHAASHAPQFAVIGGDIAYANGKLQSVNAWDTWLNYYTEEMVTPDGFQIPLVLAIGNHEVRGAYNQPKSAAPFFFGFFGQDPEHSYFTRMFGESFVLHVLDTGHIASHESQVDWLVQQLETTRSVRHRAAVYHVPLYPSHRDKMTWYSQQGRTYWAPLFDEFELTVAFENHDHTYKRSHPIKFGEPTADGSGTLYLGDGCWGRSPRGIDYFDRDYLVQSGSIQHFWLVDVSPKTMKYRAIDIDNRVFDIYPANETEAAQAQQVFNQKEQLYDLPDGSVHISKMMCDSPIWHAGQTTVTLKNVFEFPITAQLIPYFPSNVRIQNESVLHTLTLQAEESIELTLELSTNSETGYKTGEINFYLGVQLHSAAKDSKLSFKKTFGIKAQTPAEN